MGSAHWQTSRGEYLRRISGGVVRTAMHNTSGWAAPSIAPASQHPPAKAAKRLAQDAPAAARGGVVGHHGPPNQLRVAHNAVRPGGRKTTVAASGGRGSGSGSGNGTRQLATNKRRGEQGRPAAGMRSK